MNILERINPWSRLAALALLVLSFGVARTSTIAAATVSILGCLGLVLATRETIRLVATVILPFGIVSFIVAAITAGGGPVEPGAGTVHEVATSFGGYFIRFLKVAGVCTSVTILVGTLSPSELFRWLIGIRIPDRAAVYATSPLVLLQGLSNNAQAILDARLSQGYVAKRSFVALIKQLFPVLSTLISSGLASALDRSDTWARDDILLLMAKSRAQSRCATPTDRLVSGLAVLVACLIAITNASSLLSNEIF